MDSIYSAGFIRQDADFGSVCPVFSKEFALYGKVKKATLQVSALGVYEAYVNGNRAGGFVFAPGWTSYETRLQYQTYDITTQLDDFCAIDIGVGMGWRFHKRSNEALPFLGADETALIAAVTVEYADGSIQTVVTDGSWKAKKSNILYSHMYHGEMVDYGADTAEEFPVMVLPLDNSILIPQEGEEIREMVEIPAAKLIVTPKGERVIDFAQEITGYVAFSFQGQKGDKIQIHHAEMLDKDGNFYTENLRAAKCEINIVCDGKKHIYRPHYTFMGFRYIRLTAFPNDICLDDFKAVVVFSDMKRTGFFTSGDEKLNQLYENIVWGQRGNFLDVPTDCPQRDERLGWTGDAQVFARTAAINYDIQRFFKKWLHDMAADQYSDGSIPHVIPNTMRVGNGGSAAWSDASVICPWQMYLAYGNTDIMRDAFPMMRRWIGFMESKGTKRGLWDLGGHFGDWLSLDAEEEACTGATPHEYIATAFFYYSTSLVVKMGKILGEDVSYYEALAKDIKKAFLEEYFEEDGSPLCLTQTASVLALYFGLLDNPKKVADALIDSVQEYGHLLTGFVGTPYLCHVLTDIGRPDLAYMLLLREDYPSWLYEVNMGATTMWERWNGLKPDGSFATPSMNSFNHYAYGAVGDFMFMTVAGIGTDENAPGYKHILFKPIPDKRLGFVKASIVTQYGIVASMWEYKGDNIKYTFTVPENTTATATIDGITHELSPGTWTMEA